MLKNFGIRSDLPVRLAKASAALGALLLVLAAAMLAILEYENNKEVKFPSDEELRSSFLRGRDWVMKNQGQPLKENNPMLWRFIREAGRRSGDKELFRLSEEYLAAYIENTPGEYIWHFLFYEVKDDPVRRIDIKMPDWLPDYDRLFVYGMTCNASARSDKVVESLLNPSACGSLWDGIRNPWCSTHQLMGFRMIQDNRCDPSASTEASVDKIQRDIVQLASVDFRVQDAYLQRLLELAESGRRSEIKAIWIRRVLDAQRPDGGWNGVAEISELPGEMVLAWSGIRIRVQARQESNLHASAQGVFLLALLLPEGRALQ